MKLKQLTGTENTLSETVEASLKAFDISLLPYD